MKKAFDPRAEMTDAMRGMTQWTMPTQFSKELITALRQRNSLNIQTAMRAWTIIDKAADLKDFPK